MGFDYSRIETITHALPANRQSARRHYGIHPYFTRRSPNIVREYICRYSRPGDRVLDPFGGSGVTAIEAWLAGRHGIHNDINPLGNFIAATIAETGYDTADYIRHALEKVDAACGDVVRRIPRMSDKEVKGLLRGLPLPENIRLPRNSDVERFHDLFTPRQLLALGLLKAAIGKVRDTPARNQLLLAWSATLAKLNRTFLSAKGRAESRGGSSIFSIYRYKVASRPVELPPWESFVERVGNVIAAKEEVLRERFYLSRRGGESGGFEIHQEDVRKLPGRLPPVDYILTDPPYGGHIAYLDLSTVWNHWLGFKVSKSMKRSEIIVGGELGKSEEEYTGSLRKSIEACLELLKPQRWFSVVFQHWKIGYFDAILEAAEEAGACFRSAVTQEGETIWSMHKKKNPKRVLAGEMILTFFKDGVRRRRPASIQPLNLEELVDSIAADLAVENGGLRAEALFNKVVLEAWRHRALSALQIGRDDFLRLLERKGWHYDSRSNVWTRSKVESQRQLAF